MTKGERLMIDRLDAVAPGSTWVVKGGELSPCVDQAGEYPSAFAAVQALEAAGFAPSAAYVDVPDMPSHDRRSLLRYANGMERVVVARLV